MGETGVTDIDDRGRRDGRTHLSRHRHRARVPGARRRAARRLRRHGARTRKDDRPEGRLPARVHRRRRTERQGRTRSGPQHLARCRSASSRPGGLVGKHRPSVVLGVGGYSSGPVLRRREAARRPDDHPRGERLPRPHEPRPGALRRPRSPSPSPTRCRASNATTASSPAIRSARSSSTADSNRQPPTVGNVS